MSAAPPRIVLAGATGLTGTAVARELIASTDVELVAVVAPSLGGRAAPPPLDGLTTAGTPDRLPDTVEADVYVDFAVADGAAERLATACERGWHALVGATGIDRAALGAAGRQFAAAGLGLLVAPNFSLGAVLGMQLAAQIATHLPSLEIIETHRAEKLDSPSGTALHTAELMADARDAAGRTSPPGGLEAPERGKDVRGIRVHSLRLDGAVAHQEVRAGGPGELLTIRHDAMDRRCYASGVIVAAQRIADHPGLTIGLEELL